MKHTIVIKDLGDNIVENTISNVISNPKELRQRIVKRFPNSKIYFRTLSNNNGRFYIDHRIYYWFIDSCFVERMQRPKRVPSKHLCRMTDNNPQLGVAFNSYNIYEGDIIEIPSEDKLIIAKQSIDENNLRYVYLVQCVVNGKPSWCNCNRLHYLEPNIDTLAEVIRYLCGKKIKITEAVQSPLIPYATERGMLTGKGIYWMLRPVCYKSFEYKYELL